MKAAIYARFSSDLQDSRSITDQIALARKYGEARGFTIVATHQDAAISGASTINRPGLHALMADAEAQKYTVIITESLDRLSRSQADIAALYEKFSFLGVRIETLADGPVSEIHVGLKGTMSALFLKDLAQKTRRGQIGRVKAGRIPGGKSFGYDIVRAGEERGCRVVNEAEAQVVRRIFAEYAAGKGPIAIVKDLNAERIPGPTGGLWIASTILGNPKRRNGLLNNELYKGVIVYNRQRFIKDPATGKRVARENPESEWLRQETPQLRIVDDETWNAVQTLRSSRGGTHLYQKRRPRRLLSGLLRCSCCGGNFSVVRGDMMRCSTHHNARACDNNRNLSVAEVEERVLIALRKHLLAPDLVAAAVEAYRIERNKLAESRRRLRNQLEKDLAATNRKIDQLYKLVEDGVADTKSSAKRINELAAERDRLEAELEAGNMAPVVTLHPNAAESYRRKVEAIHEALRSDEGASLEAIQILRELIDHIRVIPTPSPQPLELQVVGNLAVLLVETPSGEGGAVSMVAGAGFEPATFRL